MPSDAWAAPLVRPLARVLLDGAAMGLPRHRWASFMGTPATLMRLHRELVRRKWTYKAKRSGRPPLDPEICELILRLARQNSRWGCVRIQGELRKPGLRVGATTIRMLLRQKDLGRLRDAQALPSPSSCGLKPKAFSPAISSASRP